jgi:aryl-alcohol dehydrogenase-like predicted oxidoreductase
MKYKKLGNTGLDVSQLGFGTWQLGGKRWKTDTLSENIRLLNESLNLGVNLFDVAVVYGQYKNDNGYLESYSQELLGEAFHQKRSQVIICLKLGQFDEYSHRADYSAERIVDQLQHSLRRLRTDYVDIGLIHAPSIKEIKNQRAYSVFKTLQALGYVRAIGYSFENEPSHMALALAQNPDVIMTQLNLVDNDCSSQIKRAMEAGVGVIVGGPLKRGYFSGKYASISDLPLEDDYWRWNISKNPGKVNSIFSKVNSINKKCGGLSNIREYALKFCAEVDGVCSIVVGHRSIGEVKENARLFYDTNSGFADG